VGHFEMFIAGHGGQGVLELGNLCAYLALQQGKRVAYTPSYGPETRGGKVRCYVLTDDRPLDSPIAEATDLLVVMNEPSMDFEEVLVPGGILLRNSSLAVREATRDDIRIVNIPLTDIAADLNAPEYAKLRGNLRDATVVQNAVAYGALLVLRGENPGSPEVEKAVRQAFKSKAAAIPINMEAVRLGAEAARKAQGD